MRPATLELSRRANDASLVLDLARLLAAQAVCVGHAANFFSVFPLIRNPPAPYLQNVGVIVFFWLSGFLIAHVLVGRSRNPAYTFKSYFLDRVARIYSAYLPALVVIYAIDSWLLAHGKYDFAAYRTPLTLLGNFLMLQNYKGPLRDALAVPSLGSGGPLWTLSVEFHIYVFVGACFFMLIARRWTTRVGLALAAVLTSAVPLNYLVAGVQPDVGTGLFLMWLAGFAGYLLIRPLLLPLPRWLTACAAAVFLGWYFAALQHAHEYVPWQYAIVAAGLLLVVSLAVRTHFTIHSVRFQRIVRLLADSSYSLYLLHYTIVYATYKLWRGSPMAGALLAIGLSNLVALAFASVTEFRHKDLARWLRSRLDAKSVRPAVLTTD